MLKLIELQETDLEKIKSGIIEIKQNPTPYDIRQSKILIDFMEKDFNGLLDYLVQRKKEEQPNGWVPDTTLFLFDSDTFIGFYNVRHYLTEALMKEGGHIAYEIIPSQRGKGYVRAGLKLLLTWCHDNLKLDQVLLCCNAENIASDRAMTSVMNEVGGKRGEDIPLNGHIERHVWINTKKV